MSTTNVKGERTQSAGSRLRNLRAPDILKGSRTVRMLFIMGQSCPENSMISPIRFRRVISEKCWFTKDIFFICSFIGGFVEPEVFTRKIRQSRVSTPFNINNVLITRFRITNSIK
jgi:hypothetical protein